MLLRKAFAAVLVSAIWAHPAAAELRGSGNNTPARQDNLLDNLPELESLLTKARWNAKRSSYVAPMGGGREANLTLDHTLQTSLDSMLASYHVPSGAVVLLDPKDGRILAMSEYAEKDPVHGLALKAIYPAASVFKLVTGAALIEAGIGTDEEVCFHGGKRRLEMKELKDDPRRDNRCATLATAMGKSLNVVFGKLASRNLDAEKLREVAGRFLFNQPLPLFPAPSNVADALVSRAVIPEDELGFGRAAAGFGQVYLSPLHGALMAAAIANGGVAVEPHLVDEVVRGSVRQNPPPAREQRIVSESTAAALSSMMRRTVTEGTAHKFFRVRRGNVLREVAVAGKTGSLNDRSPFKDYTWFVGFAPVEDPQVAVATVIVNGPKWIVRAPYVASEALRTYFETDRDRRRRAVADR